MAAGALGAHALDKQFHLKYADEKYEKKATVDGQEVILYTTPLAKKLLADVKTAAEYQMFHALAIIAVGILLQRRSTRGLNVAGWCFLAGCLGFSGGLYAYALTNAKMIGATIVPLGGMMFIVGWIALLISVVRFAKE